MLWKLQVCFREVQAFHGLIYPLERVFENNFVWGGGGVLKFRFHLYIASVQSCSFTFQYCSDNMLIYISGMNSDLRSSYFEHLADFVHLSMSSPWVKGGGGWFLGPIED